MKKVLIFLMCALLLVVCTGCQSFNITKTDTLLTMVDKTIQSEQLQGNVLVDVDTDVYSVAIVPTDENKITVKYAQHDKVSVKLESHENTISISQSVTSNFINFVIDNACFLLIYLPTSLNIDLNIEADTGSISVQDMTLNSLAIDVDIGSIYIDDCSVTTVADLETDTGTVVADVDANAVEVEVDTGTITLASKAQKINIKTDTGTITLNCTSPMVTLISGTGTINATLHGKQSDYNISVSAGTGSCNVRDQVVDNANSISAKTGTGSIVIKFIEE